MCNIKTISVFTTVTEELSINTVSLCKVYVNLCKYKRSVIIQVT